MMKIQWLLFCIYDFRCLIWNIPVCYGAIDGKHILIQAPANCGSEYFIYQHANSIVLMTVVYHEYCFRYIDVGSYECNVDGGEFQRCSLFPVLEGDSLLPYEGFFSGRRCLSIKTTPFESILLLSRAHRIVKNAFGILASRFRVFGKPIQVKVTTEIMVTAAYTLHDWLRITFPNTYTQPGTLDYEDIVRGCVKPGRWRADISESPSLLRSRSNNRANKIAEMLRTATLITL
ncbi:hypothetical protein PR048_000533 [Dryococelus australis]|uniref:DDE Tnp4 domain-containing protein n=1 Tax=Dryococelus australis TaxID=614101 RepID=A0ABQ9IH95_9NEOP|nr:hypothetical protein PR048_000533 [Dryococelus australis]